MDFVNLARLVRKRKRRAFFTSGYHTGGTNEKIGAIYSPAPERREEGWTLSDSAGRMVFSD